MNNYSLAFNRTRLELKLKGTVCGCLFHITFNRTRLELILAKWFVYRNFGITFNRTRLELKRRSSRPVPVNRHFF